ncbi:MAG TPA: quinoprotein dehydrogenase-associated putative ABC transporter substrate-binding protein [Burkholderiales bacterium]|nr:quinoprotein dehydrogenase-associated putative ABC transporter substrate-binding protein [Burkholderiales bacterium]
MSDKARAARWIALLASAAAALAAAQTVDETGRALRVCQDPANLPFSNLEGEGFENRIAELLAERLGWKVEYYSFPQRLGFIRNTLRFKLPGQDYACDVVMGVPARYDQAAPTRPYYRSAYALVLGSRLREVQSVEQFLALPAERRERLRIGVYDRSPASAWLARHGLVAQGVPYRILNADPEHYAGEIIEKDLAGGALDAAIVWGPIAGYFVKRLPDRGLRVLPLASEPGLPLTFEIAMGVRHGEPEWKATLDRLIADNQAQIDGILREYGVPLVDADGRARP